MQTIGVTVRGLEPGLLMGNPQAMLTPADNGPGPKAKDLPLADQAARLVYWADEAKGTLGFPATAFARATMEATKGQTVKIGGKGRAKSVASVLAGMWEVEPKTLIPLTHKGKPIKEYVVDIRTGLNRNCKPPARIVLARPLVVAPWEASFDILWDEEAAPTDTPSFLRHYLERAGKSVGVGCFRPLVQGQATGGWFGKFEVVGWEEN